jgi:hypothetical protein
VKRWGLEPDVEKAFQSLAISKDIALLLNCISRDMRCQWNVSGARRPFKIKSRPECSRRAGIAGAPENKKNRNPAKPNSGQTPVEVVGIEPATF